MSNLVRSTIALAAALALASCSPAAAPPPTTAQASPTAAATSSEAPRRTQLVTVPAPSMAGNLLGDPAEREALVTLPPSYFDGDQRYPVVYFLEGYQESTGKFFFAAESIDEQMTSASEFIIVEADGSNSLGGHFYANSPVSGNMADFVAEDLVGFVDATFRTVPEPAARGLAGFSMGGSGTINLALSRPDVFGSAYALSPGLLHPDGGLAAMLDDNGAWPPYAAAFAPDTTATEAPFAHLLDPDVQLGDQDPAVVAAYENGFGNLDSKVDAYLAGTVRFATMRLSYGTSDAYAWIPAGTAYFDELLTAKGVDHSLRTFEGGHSIDSAFYDSDFVNFFAGQFAAAS